MTRVASSIHTSKNRQLAGVFVCTVGILCAASANAQRPRSHEDIHVTANAARKLPHGAFLLRPVHNIQELIQHLDAHPQVVHRYARLTNMTPRMVKMALGRLHLKHLTEDANLEIYYCHISPGGDILGFRRRRVPQDTAVFAFADGTPALIQACGNPTRALALAPQPRTQSQAGVVNTASVVTPPVPEIPTQQEAPAVNLPATVEDADPGPAPAISLGDPEPRPADDFEPVPEPELYVPPQPAMPAAKLAAYSADNLYEWVRHRPRSNKALGATISLAGTAELALALSNGAHGNLGQTSLTPMLDFSQPTGTGITGTTLGANTLPGSNGNTSRAGYFVPEPAFPMAALAISAVFGGLFLNRWTRRRSRTH